MSWWTRWLDRRIDLRAGEFWSHFYGSDTWSGETVSEQGAMQLSAWFAGSRLISQTIATLPLGVYERDANGDKQAVSEHPLYGLLHDSPNADQTAVEFWEGRVLGLCTSGNGFAEKKSRANGSLISLERMPADTAVLRLESGSLEYRFVDRGKEERLPEEKVFHIRGFGDGDVGLSPVGYARQALGLAVATDKAASQTFAKGMRSKGFFVMPQGTKPLTPEQRKDAKTSLVDANSGPNAPWAGILEGGVTWQGVNISPKDAEMILSRKFNVEDICRWLGVPPILIGHAAEGQTMWGTGVEQIRLGWLMTGLLPYLVRIEQAAKKRLLTPADRARGLFVEFNLDGFLRGDSNTRAEVLGKEVQNGARTPNEWRRLNNLKPLPGGDRLFINSTCVPIELAGQDRAKPVPAVPPEDIQ
jgi:HK97 family phage portal protein